MKQQHRLILFMILSMGLFIAWINIGPKFFPNLFPKLPPPKQQADDKPKKQNKKTVKRTKLVATQPPPPPLPEDLAPAGVKVGNGAKQPDNKQPKPKQPDAGPGKPIRYPPRKVLLGSLEPESGYFIQAEINSRGAAVDFVKLNDERYRALDNPNEQLQIVGTTADKRRTFETAVKDVDALLKRQAGVTLRTVNWKLDDKATVVKDGVTTGVTFVYEFDSLRFKKRYWVEKVDLAGIDLRDAQDTRSAGYELRFAFTIENLGKVARALTYNLQGPTVVPLEDPDVARSHRRMISSVYQEDESLKAGAQTAKEIADEEGEDLERPVHYVGIDVQYFAAIIVPGGDQLKTSYLKSVKPELVKESKKNKKHSDISVLLTSNEVPLAAAGGKGSSVTNEYTLYAGPKRKDLLEPYGATGIINYGWFGIIARGMLWLLNFFHSLFAPYWLAIILLTVCVRGALFPLSRKQAKSANKMKELQPKIAELKKKYGDDREKMAKAQMELFARHGYNPLAGCLPVFLQFPIFIGLYQSLSNAVELRLAPFLWINNLAAPDALFQLGFKVPLLGWTTFNLLPIITIVLFIAQQKMFMPPATDEQTAMQQKLMTYMPIFFGFLFYNVPSGLCLYFIASSLWGVTERKLLGTGSTTTPSAEAGGSGGSGGGGSKPPPRDEPDKPKGFFGKLLEMADDAAAAKARANGDGQSGKPDRKNAPAAKGGGKRKKGRKRR